MTEQSLSLRLLRPVTLGTGRSAVTYLALNLRAPTELESMRANQCEPGVDAAICALALVSTVPQDVIERLSPRDFYAACTFMSQFSEEKNVQ